MPTETRKNAQNNNDHEDQNDVTETSENETLASTPNAPKSKKNNKNLRNVSETSEEDTYDVSTISSSSSSAASGPKNFKEARKLAKAEKGELFKTFSCLQVGELNILKEFGRLMFTLPDVLSNLLIKGGEEFRKFNDALQTFSFKIKTVEEMLEGVSGSDSEDALAVVEVSLEFLTNWLNKDIQALNRQPGALSLIVLTFERPVYKFLFGKVETEKLVVRLKSLMKQRPIIANQSAFKILTWNPNANKNGKKGKEAGGKMDKTGENKPKKKPY